MTQAPKVSIVIPTFDEAESLPVLVERLTQALSGSGQDYELLVIDDDSPDGTWRVAEQLGARNPHVRVIRRTSGERGLAPAVVEGWRQARGEIIGVMDADLQHPPQLLPALLEQLNGHAADVVIASRYLPDGARLRWNPIRKWISRGASNLAQAVLPPAAHQVTDPMSGYFLLRREVLDGIALQPKGYKILLEVLSRGRYQRVVEVPYEFQRRHAGQSKLGASVMRDYLVQLWRLAWAPTGFGRFVRYCLVGATGVAVNMGVLWALKSSHTLGTLRGGAVAVWLAMVNNFLWNEVWTFRDRSRLHPRLRERLARLVNFHLVCGAGAAIHLGLLWVLAVKLEWHYLLANVIAIVLVTLWNYGFNTTWTWTRLMLKKATP